MENVIKALNKLTGKDCFNVDVYKDMGLVFFRIHVPLDYCFSVPKNVNVMTLAHSVNGYTRVSCKMKLDKLKL